jgi:hypothetical protein
MYIPNTDTSDSIKILDKSTASTLLVYPGESYFYLSLLISSLSTQSLKGTDLFDDASCGQEKGNQDCDPAVEGRKDLVQDMICPGGVGGCY